MFLRGLPRLHASYRLHLQTCCQWCSPGVRVVLLHLELLWPCHQLAERAKHLAAAPAAETRQGGPDLAPHKSQTLHGPDLGSPSDGLRCSLSAAAACMLALTTWSYTRQASGPLRAPYKEQLRLRTLTGGNTLQAYRECRVQVQCHSGQFGCHLPAAGPEPCQRSSGAARAAWQRML